MKVRVKGNNHGYNEAPHSEGGCDPSNYQRTEQYGYTRVYTRATMTGWGGGKMVPPLMKYGNLIKATTPLVQGFLFDPPPLSS